MTADIRTLDAATLDRDDALPVPGTPLPALRRPLFSGKCPFINSCLRLFHKG
jgi:hypothetical protein